MLVHSEKEKERRKRDFSLQLFHFIPYTLSYSFPFVTGSFIRETLNLSIFFSSNNNMLIDDTFDFLIPDEYQRMWKYVKV